MNRTLASLLISLLLLNVYVAAQKKPVRKATPRVRDELSVSKTDNLPEIMDFAFVIAVDRYGNSTIKIQSSESVDHLTIGEVDDFFTKFVVLQNTKKRSVSSKNLDPIVVVKPDRDVEMATLIKVISTARVSYNSRIKIDASDGTYLFVPRKPDVKAPTNVKPNPLILIVEMNETGGLALNNDNLGSLANTAPLTKKLTEIFKAREVNGVLMEGSNDVEKTVFVQMPPTAKYSDLMRIAHILNSVGTTPIGLQIDEPEVFMIEIR